MPACRAHIFDLKTHVLGHLVLDTKIPLHYIRDKISRIGGTGYGELGARLERGYGRKSIGKYAGNLAVQVARAWTIPRGRATSGVLHFFNESIVIIEYIKPGP